MPTHILATKLFVPQPRPQVVARPRLFEHLNEGLHRPLILVAAPAGFGKTTLISEWLATRARPAAWLSLDEGDSDPTRFLTYFVAALQTIAPTCGKWVLEALRSPQPPHIESALTALLNDIATIPDDFALVLDDYHAVDAAAIDHALAFLLEHLPPSMHLIITTREDPNLPLARMRARGLMTELRAADLRFTPSEASAFLNFTMGINLPAEQVAALETRTEGWIAGLQLAALSMRGRADTAQFVRAFAGDNRYILDYLVQEVLQRQPAGVRSFLLETAILDRLTGPLCDAVTGQEDGSARLEALERGNFFLVALDDRRHWYRYHSLFAEVLSAHLRREEPDRVSTLHLRASNWYAQQGMVADAIRHALAAADFARAADLLEPAIPAMRRGRQELTMLSWLKALPNDLLRVRPVLSAVYAGALLSSGALDDVEARLRDAERWLEPPVGAPTDAQDAANAMVVVDDEAFRRLPGAIAVWRAGLALVQGNLHDTLQYAQRALELIPEDDNLSRGGAVALMGLVRWASGDLEAAHATFAQGIAMVQRAGHISDAISGAIFLADIRVAQGRLHEAMHTYERALQLATAQGEPPLRGTADLYVGMGEIACERNDLQTATQFLLKSEALGEHTGFPQNRYRWRMATARVKLAQGDLESAHVLLHEAEPLYVKDFAPNVRPAAAVRARLWLAQGRLGEALGWAHAQGLSAQDKLSYLHEYEHITLAKVLLARAARDRAESAMAEATQLLDRLLQAADAGRRNGSVIEILTLQALAQSAQGDIPAALAPLRRALALAEPEGYIRIFVDEGPPMLELLRQAAAQGIMPTYAAWLLGAFAAGPQGGAGEASLPTITAAPRVQPLSEPLSHREIEVLRLFRSELSGPEIADELVIALSTLRTHTKSIYGKLNVNNRRAAVKRAAELGLL